MTRIDLDELERKARAAIAAEEAAPRQIDGARMITDDVAITSWDHQQASKPPVTLALITRIRELETALGDALDRMTFEQHNEPGILRVEALLEKGALLP